MVGLLRVCECGRWQLEETGKKWNLIPYFIVLSQEIVACLGHCPAVYLEGMKQSRKHQSRWLFPETRYPLKFELNLS
jgi:hypothetical protein